MSLPATTHLNAPFTHSSTGSPVTHSHTLLPNGYGGPGPGSNSSHVRARTPVRTVSLAPPEPDQGEDNDPRVLRWRELYVASEREIDALFADEEDREGCEDGRGLRSGSEERKRKRDEMEVDSCVREEAASAPPTKKAARTIDEDDYDDDDSEEDGDGNGGETVGAAHDVSPLKAKSTGSTAIPRMASPSKMSQSQPMLSSQVTMTTTTTMTIPPSPALTATQGPSSVKSSVDDARKKLEADKKAAEDAARRDFGLFYYPVDNDMDNMLEQQKLEESDRQVDMEMNGHAATSSPAGEGNSGLGVGPGGGGAGPGGAGSLSGANLGASSLAFKHLIARIDTKRKQVLASDQQLRNLMIEVKKNRSKWASEERVGQEELYEAAEKVLSELKGGTEYSQPFLTKVNKRDVPDYYNGETLPLHLTANITSTI